MWRLFSTESWIENSKKGRIQLFHILSLSPLTVFLPLSTLSHKFPSFLLRPRSIAPSSFNMHILIRISSHISAAPYRQPNLTDPPNFHRPIPTLFLTHNPNNNPNFLNLLLGFAISSYSYFFIPLRISFMHPKMLISYACYYGSTVWCDFRFSRCRVL
jgi:hypothetical protein